MYIFFPGGNLGNIFLSTYEVWFKKYFKKSMNLQYKATLYLDC